MESPRRGPGAGSGNHQHGRRHRAEIIDRLGRDELVASLLVLYGLHPLDFETRVNQAVEKARAFLKPHAAELNC